MSTVPVAVQAAVLALLEREHGVGPRDGRCAPWLDDRLRRSIEAMAGARGCELAEVPRLLAEDRAALAAVADDLRVGETGFYRDTTQWDALRGWLQSGLPANHGSGGPSPGGPGRARRIRGLSVGCSTGEEAYTLAMVLEEARVSGVIVGWSVVGVDRSADALRVARLGEYATPRTRPLPAELAASGLEVAGGTARVREAVRRGTRFVERDATRGLPPGTYEIVICKNVLIYFGDASGDKLVDHLVRVLAPGGMLLVARSEVPRLRALGVRPRELGSGITAFGGY
ncbi:MAG: methyltransferase domain-containing protein [Polyangiaceae bacterium]|nr:methyltransferase domain-containing protein [Polyangiaceae bacterium]